MRWEEVRAEDVEVEEELAVVGAVAVGEGEALELLPVVGQERLRRLIRVSFVSWRRNSRERA